MKRAARMLLLLIVWFLMTAGSPASAQAVNTSDDLYSDKRLVAWSADFLAGKRLEVAQAVEADLKSPSPHPFAAYVWCVTQDYLGRLAEAWAAVSEPELRRALGFMPEIYLLYSKGEYKKLLSEFPPARAAEVKDLWALDSLGQAAVKQARFEDAFAYQLAAARIRSDQYQIVWSVAVDLIMVEKVRPKITELVKPGGEWHDTMLGRALVEELSVMPTDQIEAERLPFLEQWLKDRPHDARAWRRKASVLDAVKRHDEAIQACTQALTIFPFKMSYRELARDLIKQDRTDEARQLLVKIIGLTKKDGREAAPRIEAAWARALSDADKDEEARQVLEKANEQWPEDAGLNYQRAEMESDSGDHSLTAALRYAEKAVQLKPEETDYQEQLLEALWRNQEYERAYQYFLQVEKTFFQKSSELYWYAADSLAKMSPGTAVPDPKAERIKVCERSVAEYPGSAYRWHGLADALADAGRTDEALNALRASFEIRYPGAWALKKYAGASPEDGRAATGPGGT